jgi:ABC-type multidrug transport system ATPase subunit
MADIKLFCNHVIVLNKGKLIFEGEPEKAPRIYEDMKFPEPVSQEVKRDATLNPQFHNEQVITKIQHCGCDEKGQPVSRVHSGETLYFKVS